MAQQGVIDHKQSSIQYKDDVISILDKGKDRLERSVRGLEEDKKTLTLRVRDLESELKTKTAEFERKLQSANIKLCAAEMTEDTLRRHLNMPPREESSRRYDALRVSVDPVDGSSR